MKPEELKVLVITNAYPDPSRKNYLSQFVADQVEFLSKLVDRVTVVCPVPLFPIKPYRRSFVQGNVQVIFKYYLPPYLGYTRVIFKHYFSASRKSVQMGEWLEHKSATYARLITKMAKNKDFEFDVIHAHFSMPSGGAAVILKKEFHRPSVLTIHENHDWFLELVKQEDPGYIRAWAGSDLILRVNEEDLAIIKRYNANVQYIPNGFNSHHYFPDSSIAREKGTIFAFGAIVERKGYQDLVRAVGALSKEHPEIICHIAGKDGGYEQELRGLIASMKLENNVILMGPISFETAREMMNKCAVFCIPSFSESFGIVQIEAMACGAPVVATFNGASEKIIEEGCGLVVERDLLEEGLRTALTMKEWDHEHIRNMVKKYDLDVVTRRLRDAYALLYDKYQGQGDNSEKRTTTEDPNRA